MEAEIIAKNNKDTLALGYSHFYGYIDDTTVSGKAKAELVKQELKKLSDIYQKADILLKSFEEKTIIEEILETKKDALKLTLINIEDIINS